MPNNYPVVNIPVEVWRDSGVSHDPFTNVSAHIELVPPSNARLVVFFTKQGPQIDVISQSFFETYINGQSTVTRILGSVQNYDPVTLKGKWVSDFVPLPEDKKMYVRIQVSGYAYGNYAGRILTPVEVHHGLPSSWYNRNPSINSNIQNNQTLYENDTLNIAGTANDTDANQSVTVYYQINNETRRVLATDVSQKTISLSKQLTFKGGKLYDGATAITAALTEGVAHKLKVWAVDDQGGQSTIAEHTFYVVPNRAPSLTVNTPTIEGNIDTDKITLSGEYSDPDGNEATVSYKINGGNSVQIASGTSGTWEFELTFGELKQGENSIVVEIIDSYGAKTSKTIKLNKSAIETPLLQSTARYKLEPPAGSAKGVLLYIQRDKNLVIDAKISMTLTGEPENFVAMTLENTAPLPNETTILEDEFYYETTEAKDNIILQVDMTRSSIDVNDKIILIQGAFD